jgi:hypothetical protein
MPKTTEPGTESELELGPALTLSLGSSTISAVFSKVIDPLGLNISPGDP